ncbi:MAG TPA: hypothetical protein DCZ75_07340 [Geobacter sp.]|nr:hypothetical protein [Geobacter sp.]
MTENLSKKERGFVVIVLALGTLVMLFALAGLAIDVSRAYVVKGELQKAADAAALAGAGNLYMSNPSSPATPILSWANAESSATNFIGKNTANGRALTDGLVEAGYWKIASPTSNTLNPKGTVPGSCSSTGSSCTNNSDCSASEVCIQDYAPAVKVTIRKSPGNNGGALTTFFARVVGWEEFQVAAGAIAVSGFVGSVPPGLAFPFAVTACVVNDYFSQVPLPDPPTEVTDVSIYHLKNGTDVSPGQWTNLLQGRDPSAETVKAYIENLNDPKDGTPSPATNAGDPVYLDPGTKAAVYRETQQLIDSGRGLVYLPVVDCTIVPNTTMQIRGYVAFQLTSTTNSSMTGHLVSMYMIPPGTGPGGGIGNTVSAPKLVK